jgi:hypothetical protein
MAELINATTSAATSADISVSAGTTVVFSLAGTHVGADIEIRKKDSDGAYWLVTEETIPGQVKMATLSQGIRVRSFTNNTGSTITLQVYKPVSGVASGVDQD